MSGQERSARAPMTWPQAARNGLIVGAAALAVWLTVGLVASVAAGVLVALQRLGPQERRIVATAAVIAMMLLPVAWFAGSVLPLFPPATRIQENSLAHQLGGLAMWLLFLAVVLDPRATAKEPA